MGELEARDVDGVPQIDGPAAVRAAFRPALRQPKLFLLLLGVPFAIGLAVGVASSSLFIGAGAFLAAAISPILVLFRLTTRNQ